jgi:hypothetical protein
MRFHRCICLLLFPLLACNEHREPLGPADGSPTTALPQSTLREVAGTATRALAQSVNAGGPIILHIPDEAPGAPYYALLSRGFVPNNGAWAGIVFLRSPSCVPADFNLLDWFDRWAAWDCQLMVEGEEWWHSLTAPPPFQERDRGLGAVPVYFVRWSEFQAAIADDLLTITELQSLPSLMKGSASFLEHVVHNTNQPTNHGHETLVSHGTLEDGRTFDFRYNEKFLPETGEHVFPNVKIDFK